MKRHLAFALSLSKAVLTVTIVFISSAEAKPPGITNGAPFPGGAWGLGDPHLNLGNAAKVQKCLNDRQIAIREGKPIMYSEFYCRTLGLRG